jgi:hypothetical protein
MGQPFSIIVSVGFGGLQTYDPAMNTLSDIEPLISSHRMVEVWMRLGSIRSKRKLSSPGGSAEYVDVFG